MTLPLGKAVWFGIVMKESSSSFVNIREIAVALLGTVSTVSNSRVNMKLRKSRAY